MTSTPFRRTATSPSCGWT